MLHFSICVLHHTPRNQDLERNNIKSLHNISLPQRTWQPEVSKIYFTSMLLWVFFKLFCCAFWWDFLALIGFSLSLCTSIQRSHSGKIKAVACKVFMARLNSALQHIPAKMVYSCCWVCMAAPPSILSKLSETSFSPALGCHLLTLGQSQNTQKPGNLKIFIKARITLGGQSAIRSLR